MVAETLTGEEPNLMSAVTRIGNVGRTKREEIQTGKEKDWSRFVWTLFLFMFALSDSNNSGMNRVAVCLVLSVYFMVRTFLSRSWPLSMACTLSSSLYSTGFNCSIFCKTSDVDFATLASPCGRSLAPPLADGSVIRRVSWFPWLG